MAVRCALEHGNDGCNANGVDHDHEECEEEEADVAILRDEHGRPNLPCGFLGSISHKDGTFAVALVTRDDVNVDHAVGANADNVTANTNADANTNGRSATAATNTLTTPPKRGVGVDLERIDAARGRRISKRILTPKERENLGRLDDDRGGGSHHHGPAGWNVVSADEEGVLRFSLKESVYKAMHPLINEYVGFQEAEIEPQPDGTANVRLYLKSGKHETMGLKVSASWRVVTTSTTEMTTMQQEEGGEWKEEVEEEEAEEAKDNNGREKEKGEERFFLTSASVVATN